LLRTQYPALPLKAPTPLQPNRPASRRYSFSHRVTVPRCTLKFSPFLRRVSPLSNAAQQPAAVDAVTSAATNTVPTAADLAAAAALNANAALDKWLDRLAYPSLITLLALAVYLLVTLNVGRARGRFNVPARKPLVMPILNGFFGAAKTPGTVGVLIARPVAGQFLRFRQAGSLIGDAVGWGAFGLCQWLLPRSC
jgi:hypothetical protein